MKMGLIGFLVRGSLSYVYNIKLQPYIKKFILPKLAYNVTIEFERFWLKTFDVMFFQAPTIAIY